VSESAHLCRCRTGERQGGRLWTRSQNSLLVVGDDPRLVMRRVYDLYAGNCTIDDVLAAGESSGKTGNFYSHLYVGLYWEAAGDEERSRN